MTFLVDRFGRRVEYLRISLTDRCNLRCLYCVPPQEVLWKQRDEILHFEEILAVVETAARLGVRRLRLTGGEPLLRRDLPRLVQDLAAVPGIDEVSLTTNGTLLEDLAEPLAKSGLKRVNVSLDTLRPDRYTRLTRGGQLGAVWRGIAAAEQAGLSPIKLNAVVIQGLNDDELEDLARLSLERPWHVRFIELMAVGDPQGWGPDLPDRVHGFLPVDTMLERLQGLELQPATERKDGGPARMYRIPNAQGTVGFISPISANFCSDCNRLRLTPDGKIRTCLFSDDEIDIKEILRRGGRDQDLRERLLVALQSKPERHRINSHQFKKCQRNMSAIGG